MNNGTTAIVIGASMGGLCAARVLSRHFRSVFLIERDSLSDDAEPRRGVPQGRHLHGLLKGGQDQLAHWFPGLLEGLAEAGAVELQFGRDVRWFHFGGWKAEVKDGLRAFAMSRPLLEQEVRRRTLAIPNVYLLDGRKVLGLKTAGGKIVGLELESQQGVEMMAADLVVDCSGRGSPVPRWLEEMGVGKPEETIVKVNVGYASRMYERSSHAPATGTYVIGSVPESRRLGAYFPIEKNRYILVLAGVLGDHPPKEEAGFLEFARSLPEPDIADFIANARPCSDVAVHTFPAHQRRHYERLRNFPDGLVVLGDAHCSFNPIYGQGITTATLSVAALERLLEKQEGTLPNGFSRRVQKEIAAVVEIPFRMSVGEDFRYPQVEGERPALTSLVLGFTGMIHRACCADPIVAQAFYRVMHMVASPLTMLSPAFLLRVFWANLKMPALTERAKLEVVVD